MHPAPQSLLEIAKGIPKAWKKNRKRPSWSLAADSRRTRFVGLCLYAQNPFTPLKNDCQYKHGCAELVWENEWYDCNRDRASDIEDILKDEAAWIVGVLFELHTEGGSYYRSDHFNLPKVGIPKTWSSWGYGSGCDQGRKRLRRKNEGRIIQPMITIAPSESMKSSLTFWWNRGRPQVAILFLVGKPESPLCRRHQMERGSRIQKLFVKEKKIKWF